ncbi:MAG: Sec-independent protein translocase protein TatB [Neisseria sp.]|nr:Sec-independent protein translocase protein TatB [Neisseria sp.]
MFDFALSEMLLVGVVALIVLGPERLPAVARTAGRWLGKVQALVGNAKSELHKQVELADLKEEVNSLKEVQQQVNEAAGEIKEQLQEVPAWERLPEQKTPADFGVDDFGQPLPSADGILPHMVSLKRQAMSRKRDLRPKHRAKPRLRARR